MMRMLLLACLLVLPLFASGATTAVPVATAQTPADEVHDLSYAVGYRVGQPVARAIADGHAIDVDAAVSAFKAALSGPEVTSPGPGNESAAAGHQMGRDAYLVIAGGETLDLDTVVRGFQDCVARKDPRIVPERLSDVLTRMGRRLAAKAP